MRNVHPFFGTTALAAAMLVAACASSVSVQQVGSGSGAPIYDLQGGTLPALHAKADLLCPFGHGVLRKWQGGDQLDPQANLADRTWFRGKRLIGEGNAQAQMTVQCNAAADTPLAAGGAEPVSR